MLLLKNILDLTYILQSKLNTYNIYNQIPPLEIRTIDITVPNNIGENLPKGEYKLVSIILYTTPLVHHLYLVYFSILHPCSIIGTNMRQ